MNFHFPATIAWIATLSVRLLASPLDEAKVSRVVNEVKVVGAHGVPKPLAEQARVRADDGIHTGPQSRAEVIFPDHTLARLGAETDLALHQRTRELSLDRGTLLLEVPAFCGGAKVCAGALAVVCGATTALIEHLPAKSVKIVVLAGDLRVATGGFFGDSIVIPPGKMLIAAPDVRFIPDPVDVDLATLVKTSALIDATAFSNGKKTALPPLASLPRIEREIARQAKSLTTRRLIPTNLAILGSGTSVVIPGEPPSVENAKSAPKREEIALEQGAATGIPEENLLPSP